MQLKALVVAANNNRLGFGENITEKSYVFEYSFISCNFVFGKKLLTNIFSILLGCPQHKKRVKIWKERCAFYILWQLNDLYVFIYLGYTWSIRFAEEAII